MIVLFIAAIVAATYSYMWLWTREPHLHQWRQRHTERGEASWQLIIIAVSLIAAIATLTVHGDEVPAVLTQGLSGVLIGIGTGEATLRKHERKAGKAVHRKRATTRTPHPDAPPPK